MMANGPAKYLVQCLSVVAYWSALIAWSAKYKPTPKSLFRANDNDCVADLDSD